MVRVYKLLSLKAESRREAAPNDESIDPDEEDLFARSGVGLKRAILETARGTRESVFLPALRAARSDPDSVIAGLAV